LGFLPLEFVKVICAPLCNIAIASIPECNCARTQVNHLGPYLSIKLRQFEHQNSFIVLWSERNDGAQDGDSVGEHGVKVINAYQLFALVKNGNTE
jgi:hypothetical protein